MVDEMELEWALNLREEEEEEDEEDEEEDWDDDDDDDDEEDEEEMKAFGTPRYDGYRDYRG